MWFGTAASFMPQADMAGGFQQGTEETTTKTGTEETWRGARLRPRLKLLELMVELKQEQELASVGIGLRKRITVVVGGRNGHLDLVDRFVCVLPLSLCASLCLVPLCL